jgi:hypothetical protein
LAVKVEVPRDTPHGRFVLRGATAIAMRGDEVIHDANVVVVDDRIVGVGAKGAVPVPRVRPFAMSRASTSFRASRTRICTGPMFVAAS